MMTKRASFSFSIIVGSGAAACTAPGLEGFTSYDAPPEPVSATASTGATSLAPTPTTGGGESPTSTTGELGSTSGDGSSTGAPEPLLPPRIVEHELGPDPLEHSGAIGAMIATVHAEGARMQIDDAAPIELTLADLDVFEGEIPVYNALDNGDHVATFVAWNEAQESPPLTIPFTVTLPPSGTELWWNSDDAIGHGEAVAVAYTPDDQLIEFGTHYPQGQPRCYLRRRDLSGTWFDHDLLDVMPDMACSAIDLAVDADGAIYVLANKLNNKETRWWLDKSESWGEPFANHSAGIIGETANALASDGNRIAVCGTRSVGNNTDVDATAWIITPDKPGKVLSFDYKPPDKAAHTIDEIARDCVFSPTRLVLAGSAWGEHELDQTDRNRHFILEIDVVAGDHNWIVAGPEPSSQSEAHTITIGRSGFYITGGRACDDACADPQGELRMFQPGGLSLWRRPLEPELGVPRDIGWSPAGEIVFVTTKKLGPNDTAFSVRAYVPLHAVPRWSYDHHDVPDFQHASALAIGPYGQIYAGGVGAGGYPALAFVAP